MRTGVKKSSIPHGVGVRLSRVPSTVGNRDTFLKPDQVASPPTNHAYSPSPIWSNSSNTGLTAYMPKGLRGGSHSSI